MTKQEVRQKKISFAQLLKEGKNQKEAAAIVGITGKTASFWANKLSYAIYTKQRKALQKKLTETLANPAASASDVCKLADAAAKLEKCIQYAALNP